MTRPQSSSQLPDAALREFEKAASRDWQDGVALTELLKRINRVAVHLAPEEDERDSRVKRLFSERSFRHYVTLGCIESAEKVGRRSVYGYRHFVQALTVRRLLWQRLPSEQIAVVMSGRGTEETEAMFRGGIEMVAKDERSGGTHASGSLAPKATETWKRVWVAAGIELHLRGGRKQLAGAELKNLLEVLEKALRQAD